MKSIKYLVEYIVKYSTLQTKNIIMLISSMFLLIKGIFTVLYVKKVLILFIS